MAKSDFYTEIDGERLMYELRKRNVLATQASLDMGHDKSFISSSINNGKMHNSDIALLQYMFGIKKEEIIPVEVKKEEIIPVGVKNTTIAPENCAYTYSYELAVPNDFWEKLDSTIYNAVRRALE